MMLASNFDGLIPLLIGVPLLLCAVGFGSFYFSVKGHWLGLLLAVPIFLAGLHGTWSLITAPRKEWLMRELWILYPVLLVVGALSLSLYLFVRLRR